MAGDRHPHSEPGPDGRAFLPPANEAPREVGGPGPLWLPGVLAPTPQPPLCGVLPSFAQWPEMAAGVPAITSTFPAASRSGPRASVTGRVLGHDTADFHFPPTGWNPVPGPCLSAVKLGSAGSSCFAASSKMGFCRRKGEGHGCWVGSCSLCPMRSGD